MNTQKSDGKIGSPGRQWPWLRTCALLLIFFGSVVIVTRAFFLGEHEPQSITGYVGASIGGLGGCLWLCGTAGVLGRSPKVVVALVLRRDLNDVRTEVRDTVLLALGGILGLALLWVYMGPWLGGRLG